MLWTTSVGEYLKYETPVGRQPVYIRHCFPLHVSSQQINYTLVYCMSIVTKHVHEMNIKPTTHPKVFFAKVSCASNFHEKTCASYFHKCHTTLESLNTKDYKTKTHFRKKSFTCVIGFDLAADYIIIIIISE